MKVVVIPFGMRCNTAMAVNAIVNQPRLPFDWTQMSEQSMIQVLQLNKEDTVSFWKTYFSNIDETNHHAKTGSWLPHDSFKTEEEKEASVEKYVRRTVRFQNALSREEHKVFVIFFGFPGGNTMFVTQTLLHALHLFCKEKYSVIICNAGHQQYKQDNLFFIYEPLYQTNSEDENKDWNDLTKRVEMRIRDIFIEQSFEAVPID